MSLRGLSQGSMEFKSANGDTLKTIFILNDDHYRFEQKDSVTGLYFLVGNVKLQEDKTLIYCDSLIRNSQERNIQCYGHVHIFDGDSTNIYSDYMNYEALQKTVLFQKNVKLTDGKGVLTTQELQYDLNSKIGIYLHGGKVVNNGSVLTSEEATYFEESKNVYFRNGVVLRDPQYDLSADSLLYNTQTQISTFITETYILFKDSTHRSVQTREGFYDLKNRKASFGKRSVITDGSQQITGDSIRIDETSGLNTAIGNAVYIDTTEGIVIRANSMISNKIKGTFLATQHPLMILKQDKDSIYITADTLFSGRLIDEEAEERVRAHEDSLHQRFVDSLYRVSADSLHRLALERQQRRPAAVDSTHRAATDSTHHITEKDESRDLHFDSTHALIPDSLGLNERSSSPDSLRKDTRVPVKDSLKEDMPLNTHAPPPAGQSTAPPTAGQPAAQSASDSAGQPVTSPASPPATPLPYDPLRLDTLWKTIPKHPTVPASAISRRHAHTNPGAAPAPGGPPVAGGPPGSGTHPPGNPHAQGIKHAKPSNPYTDDGRITSGRTFADTLAARPTDTTMRFIKGYHHVRIFSDSLQAVSDSLFYSGKDSVFRLFKDPIAWGNGGYQVTGDTLFVYTRNKKADRLYVFENALTINKIGPNFYNQIKGTTINAYFKDGQVDFMRAKGSAESIYYVRDDNKAYSGVNKAHADVIDMIFENKELDRVVLRSDAEGSMIPFKKVNFDDMRLRGFKWQDDLRPKSKYELMGIKEPVKATPPKRQIDAILRALQQKS